MSNKFILENLISTIRGYLQQLEEYRGLSQVEIVSDATLRAAVERYLYLLTQTSIDLAEATIAFKKLRKPSTYSDAFYILAEADVISAEQCESLLPMVGFRNVIAHEYIKIDYDIVYRVLTERSKDVEPFIKTIEKLI